MSRDKIDGLRVNRPMADLTPTDIKNNLVMDDKDITEK